MKNETRSYGGGNAMVGLETRGSFEKSSLLNCVIFFSINFQLPDTSPGKVAKDLCQLQGRKSFHAHVSVAKKHSVN